MKPRTDQEILADAIKATASLPVKASTVAQTTVKKEDPGAGRNDGEEDTEESREDTDLKKGRSGMVQAFQDAVRKGKPAEDEPAEEDERIPLAGPKVQEKFKGQIAARKAAEAKALAHEAKIKELETLLEQAKSTPAPKLEDDPRFKESLEKLDLMSKTVERVSLLDSPRFKEKYEKPMADSIKKLTNYVSSYEEEGRQEFAGKLSSLINFSPGETNDAEFMRLMDKVIDRDNNLGNSAKGRIRTLLENFRETVNAKAEAVDKWTETKQKLDGEAGSERVTRSQLEVSNFRKIVQGYEEQDKDRLAGYRSKPELFKFDEKVKPIRDSVERELEQSVKSGAITPMLHVHLNNGAMLPFYAETNVMLVNLIKELTGKLEKLEKGKVTRRDADPLRETRSSTAGKSGDKKGTGYGMVDALREKVDAGEVEV